MADRIEPGYLVFVADGEMGVAGVREVRHDGLLINVQNGGDFLIPMDAVRDVHSQKVLLDLERLDPRVRAALDHAHDRESGPYAVQDPTDGTPRSERAGR
ncbi:hypothetical protein [Vulcaniibacterium tengchongense]|uniref:Uncharacterized protein n=1 Tax=Vulcaniibacterium tengchongense TaxID=1273429 RepID=A0A3N4VJR4_9GAMM|nr:hypothetical protein [Vulcaniibacterium tengchongense]RPE81943.1 hypothetical protein EDC50_1146 [Vulcaniibacterium tengchongense]